MFWASFDVGPAGPYGIMNARKMTLALLERRRSEATVCPSEVARALAAEVKAPAWRALMPTVHSAVDDLVAEGSIELSWKGKRLSHRAGPYRIRRTDRSDSEA